MLILGLAILAAAFVYIILEIRKTNEGKANMSMKEYIKTLDLNNLIKSKAGYITGKTNIGKMENVKIENPDILVKGKVVSVEELGISGNEFYRKMKINMQVFPKEKPSYQAFIILDEVKVSEIVNYAPGKEFNLRVDPTKPQKITIEN